MPHAAEAAAWLDRRAAPVVRCADGAGSVEAGRAVVRELIEDGDSVVNVNPLPLPYALRHDEAATPYITSATTTTAVNPT
jgi:hypothetical protein